MPTPINELELGQLASGLERYEDSHLHLVSVRQYDSETDLYSGYIGDASVPSLYVKQGVYYVGVEWVPDRIETADPCCVFDPNRNVTELNIN